ncbi:MAG: pyridoxal phosphate-dependent aminotransferase [Amylibacter sp.]|nr:pyridoxal phosphate-dependent aminotransferase [Amylibacter sp.]
MLATAISKIQGSPISAIFDQATKLRTEGRDLIDFSVGEPDFDTPEHICTAGIDAVKQGVTRYTPVDGTADLKAAVARKFQRDNSLDYTAAEIVISAGAKPLLATAMQAVLNTDDEVIIPTPAWPSHIGMVEVCSANPVMVPTTHEDGFKLNAATLAAAITPKTKLLLLCSPSNPTGAVYSAKALADLAEVLRRHPDILVISDDLYEHIVFDDNRFATLAAVAPDLSDRILTVNGVSKAYAMTGWRIGYAGGPQWWMDGMRKISSQINGGPCSISQAASIAALDGPQRFLATWCDTYCSRRDIALEGLAKIDGLKLSKPEGAFYLMPHCGGLLGRKRPDGQVIETSTDLASYLLEAGVVIVPGAGFFCDPYFRMSIATSEANIIEGLKRMAAACNALK